MTTDELANKLPEVVQKKSDDTDEIENWYLSVEKKPDGWMTKYTYFYYEPMDYFDFTATTLHDSMELMYQYLLSEKLI